MSHRRLGLMVMLSSSLLYSGALAAPPRDAGAKKSADAGKRAAPLVADASVATPARDAGALDLHVVLGELSRIEALSTRFHEEKTMALLARPLSSDGSLHYQKPSLLARHTDKPHAGSVLLRGQTLSFGDDKHKESIELSAQPALRLLIETFVSVLSGDLPALQRMAELRVEALPGQAGFRIHVLPKDDKVKRLVRSMSFEGKGAVLSRMELLDANGDTTVTTFRNVELRKPFSAAEQARLFRIGR